MEAEFLQLIQQNLASAYWVVFLVLLACGLGLPIPEDITLVAGGYAVYLAQHGGAAHPTLPLMIAVGMVGVLSGDTFLFTLGRWLGPRVTRVWPFRRMVPPERMERVHGFFAKHGMWTAFFARFAPGLRAPTYLLAGTARMRFRVFIVADGLAALISVPVWVVLAWYFGAQIDRVLGWLAGSRDVLIALLVIGALIVAYRMARRWCVERWRSQSPSGSAEN